MRLNKQAAYNAAVKNLTNRKRLLDKATFLYEKASKRLNKATQALNSKELEEVADKVEG